MATLMRWGVLAAAAIWVGGPASRAEAAFRFDFESGGESAVFYCSNPVYCDLNDGSPSTIATVGGWAINTIYSDTTWPSNSLPGELPTYVHMNGFGSSPLTVTTSMVVDNPTLDALPGAGAGVLVTGSNLALLESLALAQFTQPSNVNQLTVTAFGPGAPPPFNIPGTVEAISIINGVARSSGVANMELTSYSTTTYAAPISPTYTVEGQLVVQGLTTVRFTPFGIGFNNDFSQPSSIPEPPSIALCGMAIALVVAVRRWRRVLTD